MRHITYICALIVLLSAGFTSCTDRDTVYYGAVYFHKTGLFADINGEFPKTMTTTFAVKNVAYMEVAKDDNGKVELPEGWSADIDFYKGIITVTVTEEAKLAAQDAIANPTVDDPEDGRVEEIVFKGETHDGYDVTASIAVGVVEFEDLSLRQANSMVATQPGKFYTFNPTFRGEESQGSMIGGVYDCELLWKTYVTRLQHVQLIDQSTAGFYLSYDMGDYDKDSDYTELVPGNAVLAARNASDDILWSWHIWVTESDPTTQGTITINGNTFMGRNLGADKTIIDTDILSSEVSNTYTGITTDDILLSYGLYYQWGRKDPFIQPADYTASSAVDGFMLNKDSGYATIKYKDSSSSVGTIAYATEHPLTYIVGVDSSDNDWLYGAHDDNLWNDSEKSIYDPSPYGWRVPKSTDFNGVTISSIPTNRFVFGAKLKDAGGVEFDLLGGGYKVYINGKTLNLNSLQYPWCGYYWTSGGVAAESRAQSLIFSNLPLSNYGGSTSDILTNYPLRRATGMQIRCVKNE